VRQIRRREDTLVEGSVELRAELWAVGADRRLVVADGCADVEAIRLDLVPQVKHRVADRKAVEDADA